ncbi:MAG: preprotein translocase subunit SecY [Actinomycetota bacterium]|nr:preprotein translocase subunit SecY [Actinomycetota bacterium]MDQ6949017.1 preprotein translocase subunit SecY [Actinomycetota bacterium]
MKSTLSSLKNMFKVPDLRNKIIFTVVIICVYRLGSWVPLPGIDFKALQSLEAASRKGGVLSFLSLFSGGALTRFAVFGLGIMPYITAEIIIQLLVVVVPKFEQWREEGATGQKKLTQTARYLTIALAIMQATGLAFVFHNGGGGFLGAGTGLNIDLIPNFTVPRVLLIVLTMTAGTAFVMWLGELITQRGIGQGMSILIFTNVVAGMPSGGAAIRAQGGNFKFGIILVLTISLLVAIVFVEQGQRRVPVTFAKRVVGRRMYGGQSTYIPMKVNTGGVIPIIFASSVLYFPVLLSNVLPTHGWGKTAQSFINNHLVQPDNVVYIVLYGLLIIGFAYFYAAITFDPHQQAEIIRKQGGYIPGIRPGLPTERHLQGILNRITLPGALFLAFIALLPSLFLALWNINRYPFAGTTLLIAVGVALETMKQIDSQLMMRNYEGFLK